MMFKNTRHRLYLIIRFILICFCALQTGHADSIDTIKLSNRQYSVQQLRAEGNYQAALNLQAKMIDDLIKAGKNKHPSLTIHYYNMGLMYFENAEFLEAKKSLEASIALNKSLNGTFSQSTIKGLKSLGLVLLQGEFLDSAMDTFQEAQHIVHRAYGVKSTKQEAILDWMSNIYLRKNQFQSADRLQRFNYETYRANYGVDDPEIVPATIKLANWFQSSEQFNSAIEKYQNAVDLIEANQLPAKALQTSLVGLANSYYLKGQCCADQYLTRAAEMVDADISFDSTEKYHAYLLAADMHLFTSSSRQTKNLYAAAWQYGGALRKEEFKSPTALGISRIDRMVVAYRPSLATSYRPSGGAPTSTSKKPKKNVRLIGAPLPMCANEIQALAKNDDISNYNIELNFDVTPDGHAKNIKVSNTNAPKEVNQLLQRIVHWYRFRPKIVDGKPVKDHMQLRQNFGIETADNSQFSMANLAAIHGCHLLASI